MSESGGTSRATTRVRGAPNKDQYDKVKAKYKTFDKNAKIECARVEAIHATKPFTPTGNPYEYAVLYHLTQLKGDDRRKFKWIYFLCIVLIRIFSSCTRTSFCSFSEKSFSTFSES